VRALTTGVTVFGEHLNALSDRKTRHLRMGNELVIGVRKLYLSAEPGETTSKMVGRIVFVLFSGNSVL
jgi:hypothetical protein